MIRALNVNKYKLCEFCTIPLSIVCNWLAAYAKTLKYHFTIQETHHAFYIKYNLHLSLFLPFWAWKLALLTRTITSFAREWRKMAFFFNSRFLYKAGTTTYYWPREGTTKGSTFKHFFYFFCCSSLYQWIIWNSRATAWLWKKPWKKKDT